jgi:hypothetical protein
MRQSAPANVYFHVPAEKAAGTLTREETLMYIWLRGHLMKSLHLLIDDDLYDKLKKTAAARSESVAEVVRKTLRDWIEKPALAGDAPTLSPAELQELLRVMDAQEHAGETAKKESGS